MNAKRIAGALVLALGAWAIATILIEPERAEPLGAVTSSRQCQACHSGVYSEWERSWHAQAWADVEVRKLSQDFANKDCIDCHAPRPVFETGIGARVLPRAVRLVEGVDCVACHLLPDGRVAGTLDDASAACRPVATRELIAPEFCAGCHDQHDTVQQWKASRFAVPGPGFKNCVDCHMPHRGGDAARGRDHTMHGGHDLELVRSAVTLDAGWQRDAHGGEDRLVVTIENVGAGHNFPTDERSRAADVFWRRLPPDGAPGAWTHVYRFRNPYRYEVALQNTELAAGAKVELEVAGAAGLGPIEVALFYKLTPYWLDPERPDPEREAALVHREVVP